MNTKRKSGDPATPTGAEFKQLIGLYNQGRLSEAVSLGAVLSGKYPRDASLQNVLGVVNARMGQLDAALEHYDRALSLRPGYAEVQNNRGNALNRMGKRDEAIVSFKAALKASPAYAEAHNNLGSALQDAGQLDEAISSYTEALILKPNYAEAHNNLGNALTDKGKFDEAMASFSRAMQSNPGLPQAYNNTGNVLRAMGRYDEATQNFRKAIQIWPDYAQAYSGLGNALNDQGLHREAVNHLRNSLRLQSGSAATHNDLGNALSDLGRHEESMASYHDALEIDPHFAEVYYNIGNAFSEYGNQEEAVAAYSEAVRLKPGFAEAHNNLSKNKKYNAEDKQFSQMLRRLEVPEISDNERMYLSFALGKAYGDIDEVDTSFEYYSQGNRMRTNELAYDIRTDQEQFSRIKSFFDGESLTATGSVDFQHGTASQPIFIVGVPRSGTTLTEQIIASHSQVFGAGELQAASRILSPVAQKLSVKGQKQVFAEAIPNFHDQYLSEISALGNAEPFVTDKEPTNFKWIGFLLTAFPQAKIINLQRDPVACCWSMFKMLFVGSGYTNDLVDLAKYYQLYAELMDFWQRKFPNRIYDLNYEALTENQERETRRLLEYCDLPWEPQVLEFHKTRRRVRTYSDQQVRKKMYTGSSAAWRKYEKHLSPLLVELKRKESA